MMADNAETCVSKEEWYAHFIKDFLDYYQARYNGATPVYTHNAPKPSPAASLDADTPVENSYMIDSFMVTESTVRPLAKISKFSGKKNGTSS
mmetsp:Transcript_45705/g.74556  ORF Transcript_45705/g.74556 Transcript_45705/m.74556 type:complete len:92 (-) Transcript_45705:554-829(-)